MSNQNLDEVKFTNDFINKIDKSLVKEFIFMNSPVLIHNGVTLEAKTRMFKKEVKFGGDMEAAKEELLKECINELHDEMKLITQRGYGIYSFYNVGFLRAVKPSNDPNDPIIDMIDENTFKPIKGRGTQYLGLKIRYAIA